MDHPREVIEAVLTHVVRNRVEAAHARSDLFERRRLLVDNWAQYIGRGAVGSLRQRSEDSTYRRCDGNDYEERRPHLGRLP